MHWETQTMIVYLSEFCLTNFVKNFHRARSSTYNGGSSHHMSDYSGGPTSRSGNDNPSFHRD